MVARLEPAAVAETKVKSKEETLRRVVREMVGEEAAEMAERWVVDQLETLRKIAGEKFEVKQWVEEASVAACQHCRAEFSMMNRKQ